VEVNDEIDVRTGACTVGQPQLDGFTFRTNERSLHAAE